MVLLALVLIATNAEDGRAATAARSRSCICIDNLNRHKQMALADLSSVPSPSTAGDTQWRPPVAFALQLRELFPCLALELGWCERGCRLCGELRANGAILQVRQRARCTALQVVVLPSR